LGIIFCVAAPFATPQTVLIRAAALGPHCPATFVLQGFAPFLRVEEEQIRQEKNFEKKFVIPVLLQYLYSALISTTSLSLFLRFLFPFFNRL
jgi:hypothetical protein